MKESPAGSRRSGANTARCANASALFDQTSFSKFEIEGRARSPPCDRIAANDLDRPAGSCVYTQLCNEQGGIEADLTIMRLATDRFYVVTGSAFGVRDAGWIRRHLPADGSVSIREVTSASPFSTSSAQGLATCCRR